MVIDGGYKAGTIINAGCGNRIITSSDSVLINTKIDFKGRNNILKIGGRCHLINSMIGFYGDESICVLSSNCHDYHLDLAFHYNNVFYMGFNNFINDRDDGRLKAILSEQKYVFFGNECVISFGIWIRTADPHLIYSIQNRKRINSSKSVFVGDHVWLGQSSVLLKGAQIGSGSILGACSVVAGKKIPSNTIWAGNPVRQIKTDIFWSDECVHAWKDNESQKYMTMQTDKYIFDKNGVDGFYDFDLLDGKLSSCINSREKMEYLTRIDKLNIKNRFALK